MKEKELTKIGDYEIKRYYQDGDFFVDLEYHYEEHSCDIGEVIAYIGDKTNLQYGCVMELAAFKCHAHAMKPEFVLDLVENILGNGLQEYVFYKHFLFQSEFEKVTNADTVSYFNDYGGFGDCGEYNYYEDYIYSGDLDRKIKKDLAGELKLKRYKYGKYIFDVVIHNSSDREFEVEIYMFEKNHVGKILCDRFRMVSSDITDDVLWREHLEKSYIMDIYKCLYNDPSQIRISNPEFEKIYCKLYNRSFVSEEFTDVDQE